MQNKTIGIFACVLMVIGSFPLTAIIASPEREVKEQNYLIQQQNTFIFGCAGDAVTLDPADITDPESIARTDNIFEGLVQFKSGSTELQPCLATTWTVSEDGKNITLTLRTGAKFHDGTDFNADAVVFSFERQYNTSHPYHQYGEWVYWEYAFNDIQRVEKIDDYTVKIVLSRPNAAMITHLAMFTAGIVSPTNAAKYGADAFKHPCGTGPFKFVEWVQDDHITLEANDEYWQGKPAIETLVFRVIPDPAVRLQALQENTIQGMKYPDPTSFPAIKADKNLTLLEEIAMDIGYLAINNGYGYTDSNHNGMHDPDESWVETPGYNEPLTNKLVRQAINYAIDKNKIIGDSYNETAIVAKNGMPPFMLGYNDEIEDYSYDPDKARTLLTEAGYPNGFSTILWVMPVSRPYMVNPSSVAATIQAFLEAVNIHVEIYQIEWSTYLEKTMAGEHQMCLLGWTGDTGDPDNFMNPLYGANQCQIGAATNVAFYNNTHVQDLLTKALQTYDLNERAGFYKEAQQIIHEDAPFVYLAHSKQYVVFRSNITGFTLHPTGRFFFFPVEFQTIPTEPEGKILFMSRSTGPCGVAWGYQIGPGPDPKPDAYVEQGTGVIFNIGTMPYHSLYNPFFTNYFLEGNIGRMLWNLREKTSIKIDWQHEGVQHHLQVTCTPLPDTTGTFSYPKTYLICPPWIHSLNVENPELNCMKYTGFHRNGSKTEQISGYAIFGAAGHKDSLWTSQPIIAIWLFQITNEGEFDNLLTAIWATEPWELPGTGVTIEKAKTFYVNFWML